MSTSHFMMELKAVSSMPALSMPTSDGVKSTSGQRNRSLPIVITCARHCSMQETHMDTEIQKTAMPACCSGWLMVLNRSHNEHIMLKELAA